MLRIRQFRCCSKKDYGADRMSTKFWSLSNQYLRARSPARQVASRLIPREGIHLALKNETNCYYGIGFMNKTRKYHEIELIWISTALFFRKCCKNNRMLLISKNTVMRIYSSIQTTIKITFREISNIELLMQYFRQLLKQTLQCAVLFY